MKLDDTDIKNSMRLLRLSCFKHVLTHSPSNTSKQVTLHSHVQSVSAGLPSVIPIISGRNRFRCQLHIQTFETESFISCELNVHPTNDIMASYK
jgi:5-methylcytosine-specific restriction endonuclease McrA